jgi:hypothetical protein
MKNRKAVYTLIPCQILWYVEDYVSLTLTGKYNAGMTINPKKRVKIVNELYKDYFHK